MIKPYDHQEYHTVRLPSTSSKFGDNDKKRPSKEHPSFNLYDELVEAQKVYDDSIKEDESSNLYDELVEAQRLYDEYYKLRILKLLF